MNEFITVLKNETAEITEKKSRFIADIIYVENIKQVDENINSLKKKYYGSRHNCIAYRIIENGQVINMNYISSLNFRIARQIKEVSNSILKYVIDIQNDTIFNTLIASSPGARKDDNIKRFSKKNSQSVFQK